MTTVLITSQGPRTLKRDFKQSREGNWTERRRREGDGWAQPALENAAFEEYYKAQVGILIHPSETHALEHLTFSGSWVQQ